MNKKTKNKNRSKPTNPAPLPQKVEPAQNTEEAITVIAEEKQIGLVKESDSVIETPSEVTANEPVQENNEMPTDTPKKPKRNKGKKKKQDEVNLEQNKTASNQDSTPVPPSASDTELKVKSENKADTMEVNVEEEDKNKDENITASVRKKKNKKKQHEQQKIDEPPLHTVEIDVVEQIQEESKKEVTTSDKIKSDLTTHEPIESDVKQTKKKNKKKKQRLDSEKSDKADEVVICTAAFQELISTTNNEGNINPDTNIDLLEESGKSDKNLSASVEEETLKDLIQSVLLPEESNQSQDEALQSDRMNESKSKKKTKKDKKQQQSKTDAEKNKSNEGEIMQPLVVSADVEQESPSIEQVECAMKDTVPKVKAKIAKPVEKKRKGKAETLEDQENKLVADSALGDLHVKEPVIELEKKPEHTCATDISTDLNVQKIEDTVKTEAIVLKMETEKSPEAFISSDVICPPIATPIDQSIINLEDVNIGIKSSEAITKSSEITLEPIPLKSDKDLENITSEPSTSLKTPEEKANDIAISTEPYKTIEKKKKKHPKKIDISEKPAQSKVLVTPESEPTKENTLQQNEDLSLPTLSPGVDDSVEISSIKTDELVGSSDTTPDFIQHPLATSQQFVDDNNNMIISEITTTDEKLDLHLLIPTEPIIKDSGETPELVGDKVPKESSSVINIREKSLTNEPEKTDLKSKMMEVSQDMEELRLSIERSLAELTSMERSEEHPVKPSENIEAPIPLLAPPTEIKLSDAKDDITAKSKPLSENVLGEIILQETRNTSEISTENIEPKTQEENLPKPENIHEQKLEIPTKSDVHIDDKQTPPQAPARKDNKGKGKGKRKGKQEAQSQQTSRTSESTTVAASENTAKEVKKEEKEQQEQKSQSSESNENKGKQQQQAMQLDNCCNGSEQTSNNDTTSNVVELSFEPIENFEDAMTSSVDDVNKTFEMIANEVNNTPELTLQNPEINISSPTEETDRPEPKQNPVSPPKNLLGHPDIPVPSNRADYKKEKNKPPNMRQAKVKIKDAVDIERMEKTKQSRESQTENKRKVANNKNVLESFSYMTNENAEYVYKYSFRKVFLQSLCHVCRKELGQRVPCQFCSLVFYCSQKHKDEDWPQHQSLCFAICTIAHLKDQKHIYAEAKNITGQSYRLLRMQMIISCEKVLKRKLVPWEQEALLYPRMCADVACREWKQSKLADCEGCGQISYCSEHPNHLPASHQRWCRSYALYQKLVHHQQTRGRLEPKLPAGVVPDGFRIPEKINEVLAAIYDEKIDMTDAEYAALTQLATAPLTAAHGHQLVTLHHTNGISKKPSFVIHIVGAELQFEADVLFKWELFFLHLQPHVQDLKVVLVSPDLNPSNLPLNLLEKVKLCEGCRVEERRVQFSFQDKKTYYEYWASDEFSSPDIVCAFNPSIQRSSMYNGKDTWPTAVSCILKLKVPFIISSYSIEELSRDIARIKECSELSGVNFKTMTDPKCNPFASVRPDRNFITDDEVPLLFKNYCFVVLCGV